MFENIGNFFRKMVKPEYKELGSKDSAKERLHLVLMQDRANVSVDFLELMKQEIIDVIKKYIVVDENSIDVRLTNKANDDGTTGAPALYANIPIINIKNDMKAEKIKEFEGVTLAQETEDVSETKDEEKMDKAEEVQEKKEEVKEEVKEEAKEPEEDKKRGSKKKAKEEMQDNAEPEKEDEEDDDVTFDDLLKAAEEEDKK